MENYAEIFGNIMQKKVTILWKRRQIMQKFLKLIKLFPWLFQTYKIHDMFDLLLPFMDRYFFVKCSFSIVFFL